MFSIVTIVFTFTVKMVCLKFIKDSVFKEIFVCFCPNGSNLRLQTGGVHFASLSAAVKYSARARARARTHTQNVSCPNLWSNLPIMSQRISDLTKLCTSTMNSTFLLDEVCPEHSSPSADVCPSLKWWKHSKTCKRVMGHFSKGTSIIS
jgi:hypothetical protein